ncbi:MAG: hypothetical protein FJ255_05205 [Phycisphaerae bacterium]|nr:hypothetical protein [Phycisphaerae bacterium]
MRTRPSNHRPVHALLAVGWVALSGAAVSAGVINCWKNFTKPCCDILGGGPRPYLDRVCGEALCPDTIVNNPLVTHASFGPWEGKDDSEAIYPECECKWRFRYCNANDECITTNIFSSNWGAPSQEIGNHCDPKG